MTSFNKYSEEAITKMLPYSRGLLDRSNNYGIVKTETLFGFGPSQESYVDRINTSEPLEWILTHGNFAPRSLQVSENQEKSRGFQVEVTTPKPRTYKKNQKTQKKKKRKSKGVKKCIVKFLNKGGGENEGHQKKRRRGGGGNKVMHKMRKRYMMPLILGLLAAKSLLIPIALKALAFLSAKGLMMGFFSTVMASVLSLKGMFDHSHGYQNRKDDTKTQVEIIQVPTKSEDHVYYNDEHYRRGDIIREDYIRGNTVRSDLTKDDYYRNDLIRHDLAQDNLVRDDLVRDHLVRGNLVRGNSVRDETIRGNFDGGDLVRREMVPVIVNKK